MPLACVSRNMSARTRTNSASPPASSVPSMEVAAWWGIVAATATGPRRLAFVRCACVLFLAFAALAFTPDRSLRGFDGRVDAPGDVWTTTGAGRRRYQRGCRRGYRSRWGRWRRRLNGGRRGGRRGRRRRRRRRRRGLRRRLGALRLGDRPAGRRRWCRLRLRLGPCCRCGEQGAGAAERAPRLPSIAID